MDIPDRPGDIRFKAQQAYRAYGSPSLASNGFALTFPFWLSILAGFAVVMVVVIFIATTSSNSYSPSPSSGLPSARSLYVPAPPPRPGYYASFVVKDKNDARLTKELIFHYEHLKIIPIQLSAVHGLLLGYGAIEFGRDSTRFEYADVNTTKKPRPYIIYGDVSIDCGPLIDKDIGLAELNVTDESIKSLKIDLSHRGPRGPPPTDSRSFRTVYIVGKINSFSGPDSFHNSFMHTRVLDLRTSKPELVEFDTAYKRWRANVVAIAAQYQVPEAELLASAGSSIDIEQRNVHILTLDEIKERKYAEEYRKTHPLRYDDEHSRAEDRLEDRPVEHPAIP